MQTVIKFILLFSLTSVKLFSQLEFSKWYFGYYGAFDFTTNPPSQIAGSNMLSSEGSASIADASGNLLFYTNGMVIYNSQNAVMANGSGLIGNQSTTQAAIIVKQPGSANMYYVFHLDEAVATNQGAFYSIVDMSLAAGQGSVVSKNNFMYAQCCEKQVAVRHCNGKDVWIISHEAGNNNFRAYLLTSSGLNLTPVISSIGYTYFGVGGPGGGELKASPDGKKIASAVFSSGISATMTPHGFHLFDFDPSTGILSNSLTLLTTSQAYGVEFSPDGTKLYGTRRRPTTVTTSTLCQWDVCSTNTTSIVNSIYTTTLSGECNSLKTAINNKIYITAITSSTSSVGLHLINTPNNSGAAMNLVMFGLPTGTAGGCLGGLPNYVTGYTKPQNPQIFSSVNCQQVLFNAPSYTSASGCSSLPIPINGYLWDFGDAASGSANTSTLANTSHNYASLGTYTVSLIVYTNCENDTIKKVINITSLTPSINVAGTFTMCNGDKRVYTASGGTNYLWSTNATAATVALSPTTTTVYNVTGTASAGCSVNKQFTVTVNPCTGIRSTAGEVMEAKVWPNPFTNSLNVDVLEPTKVNIYDLQGRLVLVQQVESGLTEINTTRVQNGIYLIKSSSKSGYWQAKLVRVE